MDGMGSGLAVLDVLPGDWDLVHGFTPTSWRVLR